ncbi:hypothetical protein CFC21_106553 [Triticum aestivum]|uniref:F-box domain-containing protein n=2 Tax=Triticum aestivum TaxID=4565 RepID=A0A9R1N9P2_WHEAT|nr:F-box protein At3g49450-like [Triticum aestivum]KAF7105777.1 hypothetical protein CFC21_106553 [Triticum aestivum]
MEEVEKGEVFEKNTKPRLESSDAADIIILEILSRLPARSVNRFKCVSVPWRYLITDPANRKKLPQALAGFLYMSFHSVHHHHFASVSGGAAPFDPCLPYLQPNKYKDMEQVDACNGLLLYRGCTKNLSPWDRTEDDCRFVVCNPATGSWVELPLNLNRKSRRKGVAMSQVWLLIRRSHPISMFFVSRRQTRRG